MQAAHRHFPVKPGQEADFRQRIAFEVDPTQTDGYVSLQLWVVVDVLVSSLRGRSLNAVGKLRDTEGEERCDSVNFVVAGSS